MTDSRATRLVVGIGVGLGSYLVGYLLTYLLAADAIEESFIQQLLSLFDAEPATVDVVGWVFYNAHLVDIVFEGVPFIGGGAGNLISEADGLSVLLYLVPPLVLLAGGLALGRYAGVRSPEKGAIAGATLLPGYLLAVVVGIMIFEVSVGGVSGAPDLIPAIGIAGVTYPLVFGGFGGAIAAVTADQP